MAITLQSLKEIFSTSKAWEIDFRDVSIETKAVLYSVKKISTLILSVLTMILGFWASLRFTKGNSLNQSFQEIQSYVSTNDAKNINLTKLNKSFYQEHDEIASLVNTLSDDFDIQKFLQDLIRTKTTKIKFYEIIVQKSKKNISEKKINLTIRLNGFVQKDINLVESLKNDILKCPSLSQIPNCKSFFQLDHDQNGFQQEEIKFQMTIQSNE